MVGSIPIYSVTLSRFIRFIGAFGFALLSGPYFGVSKLVFAKQILVLFVFWAFSMVPLYFEPMDDLVGEWRFRLRRVWRRLRRIVDDEPKIRTCRPPRVRPVSGPVGARSAVRRSFGPERINIIVGIVHFGTQENDFGPPVFFFLWGLIDSGRGGM